MVRMPTADSTAPNSSVNSTSMEKRAVGLLLLALAQQLGHQGGAAGADHKAHAAQDHHEAA